MLYEGALKRAIRVTPPGDKALYVPAYERIYLTVATNQPEEEGFTKYWVHPVNKHAEWASYANGPGVLVTSHDLSYLMPFRDAFKWQAEKLNITLDTRYYTLIGLDGSVECFDIEDWEGFEDAILRDVRLLEEAKDLEAFCGNAACYPYISFYSDTVELRNTALHRILQYLREHNLEVYKSE